MKFVLFYHSLVSDWNHGNAHFLRGIVSELVARGHEVDVYEPVNGWSRRNLVASQGEAPIDEFRRRFPQLDSRAYEPAGFDPGPAVEGADVVIVHEWNTPELVERFGRVRRESGGFRLLFHDTHHRSVTAPDEMAHYDLSRYDGVLAFGGAVRQCYLDRGWHDQVFTWHEAADTRVFRPIPGTARVQQLVWIGNWGDDERARELQKYLIAPVRDLQLRASVHGVRYPPQALRALDDAGIAYRGWLPNWRVPEVFARAALTVHVPRGPYAHALPGIPTIRVFEALACGIPLVSAPWSDCEHLFEPGNDYLAVRNGRQMRAALHEVLNNRELATSLAASGLRRILTRHTCSHRVDELMATVAALGGRQGTATEREMAHA
ncbi:MAG TPA: glycosyltransferase [Rhodanobacteraceae bacterium]|jgi:spore maturation protein CgeB|nr:glycosyltransferase [Rhodanobacteraceae bacterium]